MWEGGLSDDIREVLFDEAQIAARVRALGEQIVEDYQDRRLLLLGILKGSYPFMADLARAINLPLKVDFMAVSSYGDKTRSSGVVKIVKDLDRRVDGTDILIVEDIVDSGRTLHYLLDNLRTRAPSSVEVCTLLDKVDARVAQVDVRYTGFPCPNEFVVGYGLDYAGKYRNLPYIGALKAAVYE